MCECVGQWNKGPRWAKFWTVSGVVGPSRAKAKNKSRPRVSKNHMVITETNQNVKAKAYLISVSQDAMTRKRDQKIEFHLVVSETFNQVIKAKAYPNAASKGVMTRQRDRIIELHSVISETYQKVKAKAYPKRMTRKRD